MKAYTSIIPTPFLLFSRRFPNTVRCFPSSNKDDALWLREEQRWLREEQRWLREEQRWVRERASLIGEIESLKLCVQSLERRAGGSRGETLLEAPQEKVLLAASSESVDDAVLLEGKKRKVLRRGCEGVEVRELQEALQNKGFYSGEEDIEYSSFSTGTERAVKTWQASLGVREDGVMTEELLERLFSEQEPEASNPNFSNPGEETVSTAKKVDRANGAEVEKMSRKGVAESASYQGVFLLGENRWEKQHKVGTKNTPVCISCRGEGRLLCTECDGSGEPNIEPQFLEWIEEGAPCPYCEGEGFVACDMCEGKAA